MKLRRLYLILAVLGVLIPLYIILDAMRALDWNWAQAAQDLDAFVLSPFGKFVLFGYFLAGLSLTIFMMYEANARSDYYLYWALPVVLIFGIGVALPFYLYLRMPRWE